MAGREVERARGIGPPVDYQGRALRVVLPDSDTADVMVGAVGELEPAETQTVLARVQSGKQTGLLSDQDIPLQPRLEPASGRAEGALYGPFGLVAQGIEAGVERCDELLFIPEFFG
ncbi:hypothetical protein OG389_34465 [Streptomyces sp. NBC_00435]|uniref:hypothetical protein n=1 Tax=Streptomyces sp. NBC_00435 TaxID=2903649 RepID=UPI002E1EC55D